MNLKEKFKEQLKRVMDLTGESQEKIAVNMGYGKNYISEILSPTSTISKKFLNAFELKYKEYLEKPKSGEGVKIKTYETRDEDRYPELSELGMKLNNDEKVNLLKNRIAKDAEDIKELKERNLQLMQIIAEQRLIIEDYKKIIENDKGNANGRTTVA
jgi:transcriptional regulator with XRE-family HTH domain